MTKDAMQPATIANRTKANFRPDPDEVGEQANQAVPADAPLLQRGGRTGPPPSGRSG